MALRALHQTTALGGRVNDVGSTAWERALAMGFRVTVGAHGYAGQASSRSSGSSSRLGCGRQRTRVTVTAVEDRWNVSSLGPSPGRQSMGSGQYSCSGDAACRADGQGCRSARTESGVINRCGRRRAVDEGRAGYMKNTGTHEKARVLEGSRCNTSAYRMLLSGNSAGGRKRYLHCMYCMYRDKKVYPLY